MSTQTSPVTRRRYPLTMVCGVYRVARPTVYARTAAPAERGKRGPHTSGTDDDLVVAIRTVLAETPFHGEGHRKVRVRLRASGWQVGKNRVLRLMRAHGLLAPQRAGHPHGDPVHAGTITTDRPNVMWGTDATRFYTERKGWSWFFGAIDHASDDIVGWHVANTRHVTSPDPEGNEPKPFAGHGSLCYGHAAKGNGPVAEGGFRSAPRDADDQFAKTVTYRRSNDANGCIASARCRRFEGSL